MESSRLNYRARQLLSHVRAGQRRPAPEWLTAQELRTGDYLALPARIDVECEPQLLVDADVSVRRGRHAAIAERVAVAVDDKMARVMGLYVAEGSVSANTSYLTFDSAEDA